MVHGPGMKVRLHVIVTHCMLQKGETFKKHETTYTAYSITLHPGFIKNVHLSSLANSTAVALGRMSIH